MQFTVPPKGTGKPIGRRPKTARAGVHDKCAIAAIRETVEEEDGDLCVVWHIRDEGKRWRQEQFVTEEAFGDILVALGYAGQDLDTDTLVGKKAVLTLKTFGGRQSAEIIEIQPVPVPAA